MEAVLSDGSDVAEAESEKSIVLIENPAVFLCRICMIPLADSGDCIGRVERDNLYLLKAVTENVDIDETKSVSSYQLDDFSTLQVLYCRSCSSSIGALYVATPRHLDYKRNMFNINTSAVTCYYFDNSNKQRAGMNEQSVTLPTISYMEEELKKCRMVFGCCERAVEEIESKLFESSETPLEKVQ